MASTRTFRRSDGYSYDSAASGHPRPAPRARFIPHLICATAPLLSLPGGVSEACDASIISSSFSFDPVLALSSWDVVGECENGCCCGPNTVCSSANGAHIWFDDLRCTQNWTCENHATDFGHACGTLCYGARASNNSDVVVKGEIQCGGYGGGGSAEVQLGVIHFDWTPEITYVNVFPDWIYHDLTVGYHFPQSWTGARSLTVHEISSTGAEITSWNFCGGLGRVGSCHQIVDFRPDTVEIRVVANACGDASATVEKWANIEPPPEDLGPSGRMVPDDDASDEPNSCPRPAQTGAPVRLTNGNMRYNERLVLPTSMPQLTSLTFDTLNTDTGVFGKGWFSAFDAGLEEDGGSTSYRYRVVTETNHSVYFSDALVQTWPATGPMGELVLVNVGGTDYYRHTSPAADLRRFYRASDGKLGRLEAPVSEAVVTIDYHPSTGMPTLVSDAEGAWSWTIDPDATNPDLIGTITAGDASWAFGYDTVLLDNATVDGGSWRAFSYDGDDRLLEVSDGQGHLIETHEYDAATGRAITSQTTDEHITYIEYEVPNSQLPRGLNFAASEYAARVTMASGKYTDYYIRPVGAAPHRVVEIRGDCSCPGGGEYTAMAYDGQGRVVRKQDARGYITVWSYDAQNRVQRIERGHWPGGCDPADYPEDPTMCRLNTDELAATALSIDGMLGATDYTYDAVWTNKPATMCTESVVEPGQSACDSYTYDPVTGAVLTTTRFGYTWDHYLQDSQWQSRTTTRALYNGTEGAAFDPTIAASQLGVSIVFDPSWVSLPQPANLVKSIDGPRPSADVDDISFFVFYPEDVLVLPAELRGRLAARMDPEGGVVFFDGYDALGNVTRTIDPSGVASSRQHDSLGRVTTNTLEGIPGCDTVADPLCDTDLVTTYEYLSGAGPLEKITAPGGGVSEYGHEGWGRVETVSRGPGLAVFRLKGKPKLPRQIGMEERVFTTYDPLTGNRASESLERWETGAWVERKRTDYRYDSAGRLEETEYPDTPANAIESYAYDPQGNVVSFWNPLRYGDPDPNVKYVYDPLGRLEEVKQLEDATQLPSEDAWAATSYGYDSQSNLTAVTDANGNVTAYLVDDFGQTYEIDSPATGVTKLTYNETGQVVLKEDARTATATHTYDAAGRLEVSVYQGLSIIETITSTYDANGRRLTADTGDLFETWSYDRRGLTIFSSREKEWMGSTVLEEASFAYSEDGALETITYPSGRLVSYGLDFAGRPESVSATGAGGTGGFTDYVSDVSYLPFGPADAVTYPLLGAGTTDNRPHDPRYRLTSQNPGLAEPLRAYTYDLSSNLLTADNLTGITDEVYTYDDIGRLDTATGEFGAITYGYDSIGNLLSRDAVGGPEPGQMDLFYEGGTSPLVERVETTPDGQGTIIHDIIHDAMGNILDDGVSRYFWDPRPIMRFHKKGGTSAYYRYSDYTADGIMTARRAYTVDPVVYYAQMVTIDSPSGHRLSERLWDMNFTVFDGRELVWLGDRLIATFGTGASDPDYVFTDHIGYPVMIMDPSASTTWSAVHEPYGEAILTGGTAASDPLLRYPGQWKDDPAFVVTDPPQRNLFANGYRWYNPDWGRYTQSDPILPLLPEYSYFKVMVFPPNAFSYASGNPARFIDPLGMQSLAECQVRWTTAGGAVGGGVGGVVGGVVGGAGGTLVVPGFGTVGGAVGGAGVGIGVGSILGAGVGSLMGVILCECPTDDEDGPCEKQLAIDEATCSVFMQRRPPATARYAQCMSSAMDRYANCRAGRPVGPLFPNPFSD